MRQWDILREIRSAVRPLNSTDKKVVSKSRIKKSFVMFKLSLVPMFKTMLEDLTNIEEVWRVGGGEVLTIFTGD
jgi:hypothetical protein